MRSNFANLLIHFAFTRSMNVLALTILISTCLAAIFIVCFIADLKKKNHRSLEHDSLMPLNDDTEPITTPSQSPSQTNL